MKAYLENMKWADNYNAIPIIHNPNGKVSFEKIWDSVKDWSYLNLMEKIDEEVIIAFWVPPILLWIVKNSTQANQQAQEKKFYNEEVKPLSNMIAKRFTQILKLDLWLEWVKLIPKVPDFKDLSSEIDIVDKWLKDWILSINEWRNRLWLNSLTDKDWNIIEWANKTYVTIWNQIIPVDELNQFTSDTIQQANLWKLLEQVNEVWENLQKWVKVNEEYKNLNINYENPLEDE